MATSNHKKQYTTLSDIDHVLLRPEVIIGSNSSNGTNRICC